MPSHPQNGRLRTARPAFDLSRVQEPSDKADTELYQKVVDHAPVGFMVLQAQPQNPNRRAFKILAVNQAAVALSGLNKVEAADLRGKLISEVFPSISNRDLEELTKVLRSGRPQHLGQLQQGEARVPEQTLSIQAFWLPDDCLGLAFESISERKRAEEALHVIGASVQEFIESAPDAMLLCDSEGRILLANSQTEQLFGYSRAQLYHQPVELLIPERFCKPHLAHRAAFLAQPHARKMGSGPELFGRRADGTEFPAEISLSTIRSEAGPCVCAAIRDLTAHKRAELALRKAAEELTRSNTELDQFAHAASHDLQEPLRTIASLAQLVAMDYSDKLDAQGTKYLSSIVESARRMQWLLNGLLKYSRVGAQRNLSEMVDCEEICDAALADLRVAFEQSQAVLTREPLPTITGNRSQLIQLFQNLLANAIKFRGPRSPQIHVSAQRHDQEWILGIRDNGIGIEPNKFEQIFLLFHRLHTREYPGTGIGLALCKKIVAQHGGRLWVESTPGEGSTFFFALPAAKAAAQK